MSNEPITLKGYTRPIEITGKVFSALAKAADKHKSQRIGQLIYNALRMKTPSITPENFHSLLFNVYDELLAEALEAYAKA